MRILGACVIFCFLSAATFAIDEHRPKKRDDRGKRNLQNQISTYYSSIPRYHLERRISTGSQYPHPPQYYSRPYHKDTHNADLLTESNGIQEHVDQYGPHKPHIVERPVYIKEPEPIIEIIIKESNVSLPAPPPPPPPPKKKKEQVHVFYVKYKKNPNGYGKDSIIYDKPVPAITPKLPDDDEEEEIEAPYNYHKELVTAAPPPSTTLRTVIKPDSEVYHSPSGIKVTFGKEGFDYDKRSSKPDEYSLAHPPQFPHGRQLTSFSNAYYKTPLPSQHFQGPPTEFRNEERPRRPYRPVTFPVTSFGRQTSSQFSHAPSKSNYPPQSFSRPNQHYNSFGPPPLPQYSHSISHPPPPNFQNPRPHNRQPVPYTPFENFRPQQYNRSPVAQQPPQPSHDIPQQHAPQQIQFRPETHFPIHQQLPLSQTTHTFSPPRPNFDNNIQQQYRPEPQKAPQHHVGFNQQLHGPQQQLPNVATNQVPFNHLFRNQQGPNEHNNLNIGNILPPGGQLIQSVPKYEQHISSLESTAGQQNNYPVQNYQGTNIHRFNENVNSQEQTSRQQNFIENNQKQEQFEHYLQQQRSQQSQPQAVASATTHRALSEYTSTRKPYESVSSTTQRSYQISTTKVAPTTTTEATTPSTATKDPKILEAQLPDEVPEELREQLLSSGILNNADISILDYDKVGDIPLSALPPDQLANFYNAGGATQLSAGSAPVAEYLRQDGSPVDRNIKAELDMEETAASEIEEVKIKPNVTPSAVDLKVVHYDPQTENGRKLQGDYVEDQAQETNPVVLNDSTYNRYLPLKVDGAQFPIPDVPELKNRKISSVVILAPVSYDFSSSRESRHISESNNSLIKGTPLKSLMANPTSENFQIFLKNENETRSDKQSVILLVVDPSDPSQMEKEIFMYDVGTKTVSKLSGELSSAFVEAAEANSSDRPSDGELSASNIQETRVPFQKIIKNGFNIDRQDMKNDSEDAASDLEEVKIPILDPTNDEVMETEASEQLGNFVDISGRPVEDLTVSASDTNSVENQILLNSGYSKTVHS